MIQPVEYRDVSHMLSSYADRRRRLMGADKPAIPQSRLQVVRIVGRLPIDQNHHVLAWRAQTSAAHYVAYECAEHGLSLDDIRAPCRKNDLVRLRGKIGYALKTKFKWSYHSIARYLRRDHSSIIGCIKTYCDGEGLKFIPLNRSGPGVSEEKLEEIRQLFEQGMPITKASISCGVPPSSAHKAAVRAGWYENKRVTLPIEAIHELYLAFEPIANIAKKHHVSERTINRLIEDMEWPKRPLIRRAKAE